MTKLLGLRVSHVDMVKQSLELESQWGQSRHRGSRFPEKCSCEQSRSTVIVVTYLWKPYVLSAIVLLIEADSFKDGGIRPEEEVKEFVGILLNCHTDHEGMSP